MKKLFPILFALSFLFPTVSSASALTNEQANSLISVVQSSPGTAASAFVSLITAFSNITVTQAESLINVVQQSPGTPASAFTNLLVSFTIDPVVVQQTPPVVGSIVPTPQPTPTPQPVVVPNWTITLTTENENRISTTTVKAGTGRLKLVATVDDKNGNYVHAPITVTTNDPDLPSSFIINVPKTGDDYPQNGANFFCVAPNPTGGNGCPSDSPVSVGIFDFTFTVEDVSKTLKITVTQ